MESQAGGVLEPTVGEAIQVRGGWCRPATVHVRVYVGSSSGVTGPGFPPLGALTNKLKGIGDKAGACRIPTITARVYTLHLLRPNMKPWVLKTAVSCQVCPTRCFQTWPLSRCVSFILSRGDMLQHMLALCSTMSENRKEPVNSDQEGGGAEGLLKTGVGDMLKRSDSDCQWARIC